MALRLGCRYVSASSGSGSTVLAKGPPAIAPGLRTNFPARLNSDKDPEPRWLVKWTFTFTRVSSAS
jgi:hypothetical protein